MFSGLGTVGEEVIANGSTGTVFPIPIPLLNGIRIYLTTAQRNMYLFRSGLAFRANSPPQTQPPKRNPSLGFSDIRGGAARWPDGAVIRKREGRSAAVGEVPELTGLRFVAFQPTFGKALELHHLLAELLVAGLWTGGWRDFPPRPQG